MKNAKPLDARVAHRSSVRLPPPPPLLLSMLMLGGAKYKGIVMAEVTRVAKTAMMPTM